MVYGHDDVGYELRRSCFKQAIWEARERRQLWWPSDGVPETGMKRPPRCILLGCIIFSAAALVSCAHSPTQATAISVGAPALEQSALLYVAEAKKLFAGNGIAITIKDFTTGPAAIAAMMSGIVDVAETAEFPLVEDAMNGQQMRILAENDRFENDYLVVRGDRGISNVSDLRGKRIGVTMKAITAFYLGRFLTLNGISSKDVTEVNVQPADFVRSILDGRVDGVVAWQPFVGQMEAARPGSLRVWPVQSGQDVYGLLVCTPVWLTGHSEAARRFLKSLVSAQDFLVRHPDESQAIVARRLNYRDSYLSAVWPKHEFALTLDFSLVAAMDGEARWLIANHLTGASHVRDLTKLIYLAGLDAVRPAAVNMMQ